MTVDVSHHQRTQALTADPALDLPDLRPVVGGTVRLPDRQLETVYLDTPDLRLWHRGLTLRHQAEGGGGPGTWALGVAVDQQGRAVEDPLRTRVGERASLPGEMSSVLAGIVRFSSLREVAELATSRQRFVLGAPRDEPLGALDDDTVTVRRGRSAGLVFRRIRIELDPRAATLMPRLVELLDDRGATPDDEHELARAQGIELPRSGAGSLLGGRGRNASKAPIGDVVRASVDDGLDRLLDRDYRLRLEALDPRVADVHQARVATRRLRSDLTTFLPLLDPVWTRHVRAELGWLGGVLGRVRDLDVLAVGIPEPGTQSVAPPGTGAVLAAVADQRRRAATELAHALADERYKALLERLHSAARRPPFFGDVSPSSRAADVLPRLVAPRWRAVRRRVRRAGPDPDADALHRVRIGAKQLRYAAEAAAPVVGPSARRTAVRAGDLQDVLGRLHDAVAAERWLTDRAAGAEPAEAFAAGWLAAEQRRRQQELGREWEPVWRKLERTKHRRWLR